MVRCKRQGKFVNITIVQGYLSRPPEVRSLPSGDVLVAYEVTVPAAEGRRAESVPVVWLAAPPSASGIEAETEVVVIGRVRRRFFRAAGGTQSRTEVVADQVVPARQAKRAARLVLAALGTAEEAMVG
jgi:single-strand DNA-binding protein